MDFDAPTFHAALERWKMRGGRVKAVCNSRSGFIFSQTYAVHAESSDFFCQFNSACY